MSSTITLTRFPDPDTIEVEIIAADEPAASLPEACSQPAALLGCPTEGCSHTECYRADSRSSFIAAKARIHKHLRTVSH
jgi:hypothetical protein